MATRTFSGGTVHGLPGDLRDALAGDAASADAWADITPLARNEWICWVTSPKQDATRAKRIRQAIENLADGKRRPCCWPGCPHRERNGR